ncbi:hypothetical protein CC86DRAFT_460950 [Ophiobolus disseminans]|uniref:Uncharacterized protein n=1 Tax=Ophiobolus disseminans TaxID=1469910 RepID=A0A6A6ZBX7_9PLEO|nr:hypothetical protein CC86DRAFT_460950 [Ophiobolus disseminans]
MDPNERYPPWVPKARRSNAVSNQGVQPPTANPPPFNPPSGPQAKAQQQQQQARPHRAQQATNWRQNAGPPSAPQAAPPVPMLPPCPSSAAQAAYITETPTHPPSVEWLHGMSQPTTSTVRNVYQPQINHGWTQNMAPVNAAPLSLPKPHFDQQEFEEWKQAGYIKTTYDYNRYKNMLIAQGRYVQRNTPAGPASPAGPQPSLSSYQTPSYGPSTPRYGQGSYADFPCVPRQNVSPPHAGPSSRRYGQGGHAGSSHVPCQGVSPPHAGPSTGPPLGPSIGTYGQSTRAPFPRVSPPHAGLSSAPYRAPGSHAAPPVGPRNAARKPNDQPDTRPRVGANTYGSGHSTAIRFGSHRPGVVEETGPGAHGKGKGKAPAPEPQFSGPSHAPSIPEAAVSTTPPHASGSTHAVQWLPVMLHGSNPSFEPHQEYPDWAPGPSIGYVEHLRSANKRHTLAAGEGAANLVSPNQFSREQDSEAGPSSEAQARRQAFLDILNSHITRRLQRSATVPAVLLPNGTVVRHDSQSSSSSSNPCATPPGKWDTEDGADPAATQPPIPASDESISSTSSSDERVHTPVSGDDEEDMTDEDDADISSTPPTPHNDSEASPELTYHLPAFLQVDIAASNDSHTMNVLHIELLADHYEPKGIYSGDAKLGFAANGLPFGSKTWDPAQQDRRKLPAPQYTFEPRFPGEKLNVFVRKSDEHIVLHRMSLYDYVCIHRLLKVDQIPEILRAMEAVRADAKRLGVAHGGILFDNVELELEGRTEVGVPDPRSLLIQLGIVPNTAVRYSCKIFKVILGNGRTLFKDGVQVSGLRTNLYLGFDERAIEDLKRWLEANLGPRLSSSY